MESYVSMNLSQAFAGLELAKISVVSSPHTAPKKMRRTEQ